MARKERNDVDYFPHKIKSGKRMGYMEKKYGNDGYAVWWKLLEELGRSEFHYIDVSDQTEVMLLAGRFNVTEALFLAILEDLIKLNVFDKQLAENGILFSEEFVKNVEEAYSKRKNSIITLPGLIEYLIRIKRIKSYKAVEHSPVNVEIDDGNTQSKVKYSKVKETKVNFIENSEEKEDLTIQYFFRIGNKIFKEKISDWFKREKTIFLEQWGFANKDLIWDEVWRKIDTEKNTTTFNNENHIQNTFTSNWKEIRNGKQFKSSSNNREERISSASNLENLASSILEQNSTNNNSGSD